jgi:hypothetical protein
MHAEQKLAIMTAMRHMIARMAQPTSTTTRHLSDSFFLIAIIFRLKYDAKTCAQTIFQDYYAHLAIPYGVRPGVLKTGRTVSRNIIIK